MPMPVPAPEPAPESTPTPETASEPGPAPESAPEPEPTPEPMPVSQPPIPIITEGQDKNDKSASPSLIQFSGSQKSETSSPKADGWSLRSSRSAMRPPARVGSLLQFGRASEPTLTLSFGPTTTFDEAVGGQLSRESTPVSMRPAEIVDSPPTEPAAQVTASPKSSVNLEPSDGRTAAQYTEALSERLGSPPGVEVEEGAAPVPSAAAAKPKSDALPNPMKVIISLSVCEP